MTNWLVDTLLMTSALMLLVLLVRRPVGRWFGPAAAYALWALPMIRLFLPPLVLPEQAAARPEFALSPTIANTFAADAPPAFADVPPADVTMAMLPPEPVSQIPWGNILLAIWLGGAVLFLIHRTIGYRAMRRELLRDARQVGSAGNVRIVESPAVVAPLAFGVFDKVVALPAGFLANADSDASDFAIAHELEHHAANDLAANIAVQPLFALHWFNPIAWLAWRALRSDQEAACDARVVRDCGRAERERYGRLIASFAGGPRLALAAPMAGVLRGEKPIIHRLKALVRNDVSERRRLLGRSLFAAAIIGVPMTATITYAAVEAQGLEDAPPADAVPPEPTAPVPPEPAAEHGLPQVFIREIDHSDCPDEATGRDCTEEHQTYRRKVVRGGRSYEFVTSRQLSDAEIDERIQRESRAMVEADRAEAEADRAEAEAERNERAAERQAQAAERQAMLADRQTRVATAAGDWAERHAAEAEHKAAEAERRADMAERMAPDVEQWTSPDGKVQKISIVSKDATGRRRHHQTMVIDSNCAAGSRSQSARSYAVAGGSASETRVCTGTPDVSRHIAVAFRQARASISANRSIPAEVRADILANFDEQIAEANSNMR